MSDIRNMVQDLRAHAHEVPEHLRDLIRRAAAELERRDRPLISALLAEDAPSTRPVRSDADAAVLPVPIPPPADDPADDPAGPAAAQEVQPCRG